jgi:hypothetical protein
MSGSTNQARDYAGSGLTIREAFLDHVERFPDKAHRPDYILWNGLRVKTAEAMAVPSRGTVRGEFLSQRGDVEQGFDLKVDGWIELSGGERVHTLRTWNDPAYETTVEYAFQSKDRRLWMWNVYKVQRGDEVIDEKWTENAGMWVEEVSSTERIYHCSHGMAHPPNFESLVFKITVKTQH